MLLLGYHNLGGQDVKGRRTVWQVDGIVNLKGKRIDIGSGTNLSIHGSLYLGDHSTITGNSSVICRKSIRLEDDALISWDVLIMDTDFHTITDEIGNILNSDEPIVISNHVWVGCRSTILKGTIIPRNSVIAAGSVITGKMSKENVIYTSCKRVLREDICWIR